MTLNAVYTSMADIVARLKLKMPINVRIQDPITGDLIQVDRENLLALLVIDTPNLVYDSQILSALFMEMARARRACERAAALADRSFVRWKAQVSTEARLKKGPNGKTITGDEAKEAYRTHPEYEDKANAPAYWQALASLFEDACRAFELKARMIESQSRMLMGDFRAKRTEDMAERSSSARG